MDLAELLQMSQLLLACAAAMNEHRDDVHVSSLLHNSWGLGPLKLALQALIQATSWLQQLRHNSLHAMCIAQLQPVAVTLQPM